MTDLLAARSQMAMSLGFHIIFACVGMAMPLLMVIAEWRWLKTRDAVYKDLAQRWAKGTAVMFAVGAVSGTALSFELGLLWPTFMEYAGPIVGMPFSLEGFAFFLEAIFLGIYLYGWTKVREGLHLLAGIGVMVCGLASAFFVICANAWMNTPQGFEMKDGEVVSVDPIAAMFNPAAFTESLHMIIASFVAVGFAVAGIHAWALLKRPKSSFHRKALTISMVVGAIAALLQPLSGDLSAKHVAEYQPVKLAAMEGHFKTETGAPLRIGGIPDEETRETNYSIDIPYLLSILAFADPHAEVVGLEEFPEDEWPPVLVVHIAFQIMVGCGLALAAVGLAFLIVGHRRRGSPTLPRWLLRAIIFVSPLGFIAVEAGWTVTEVGRQPWIIHGFMRTEDAVTPMPNLHVPFIAYTLLYLWLGVVVIMVLRRYVKSSTEGDIGPDLPDEELDENEVSDAVSDETAASEGAS